MRIPGGAGPVVAGLAVAVAGVSLVAFQVRGTLAPGDGPALVASLLALACLLLPVGLLSCVQILEGLRRFVDARPITTLVLAGSLLCPYCLYWGVAGEANPGALFRPAAYVIGAALLALALPSGRWRAAGDALVVLAVWLPLEGRWLRGSFPWPGGGSGSLLAGVLGLDLLLFLVLVVRRMDGVGYGLLVRPADLGPALGAFAAFAAIGVPAGLWSGFLAVGPRLPGPIAVLGTVAGIFLFTGIPEEMLFRGCIQGMLERWTGRPWPALGAAALVFGAAHLDNSPAPDWRYFALSSLAGVAYGWVYRKTRRIAAAALVHTLVDATWVLFLKGR